MLFETYQKKSIQMVEKSCAGFLSQLSIVSLLQSHGVSIRIVIYSCCGDLVVSLQLHHRNAESTRLNVLTTLVLTLWEHC